MIATDQTRTFLIALGVATLVALGLLWKTSSDLSATSAEFDNAAQELNRLERRNPYPTEANFIVLKEQSADFKTKLEQLKADLQKRVLPAPPLAPNEFQARLRQTVTTVTEHTRASKVQLPANFFLGFDEFSSGLPETALAPLLGQQLSQIELLMNLLIDARVDAITSFQRGRLPEERPAATPTSSPSRKRSAKPENNIVERSTVEVSFTGHPTALRHVINEISGSTQQFFVIRTLQILNEKDKGPPRASANARPAPASAPAPGATPAASLDFIVGTEEIEAHATIELLRFNLK